MRLLVLNLLCIRTPSVTPWQSCFNVCLKSSRSDLEMYSSTRRLSKNHRRLFHVQQTAYGDSKFVRYSPIKLKTVTTAPMEHEPC